MSTVDTDGPADLLRKHWGFADVRISALTGGMNSTTWSVAARGALYVAKQVALAEVDQLSTGCAVAALVADAGIVTGRPVPTVTGELVAREAALALLEHVPGRALDGSCADEQRWMAETLAGVHRADTPTWGRGADFFDWLAPTAVGVDDHPWLGVAIRTVRAEVDPLPVSWSCLHADPAPEAFLHDDLSGLTGLIDWAGGQRGPVLYDVASAVMYLGGGQRAAAFLDDYRSLGPLHPGELRHLDAYRRLRWAVQGAYFARRLAENDLTGLADPSENVEGLADARRGLTELGVGRD